ncbi:hypothetical protein FFLO_00384 [Filobasidium floriforme]|uniref:Uncharacterized protein n=1 Tax=Filobasidium floriforme TaxID=5210 RepID=A0A8K0JRP5_9TREE|nr:uncharacterized protein HD553DRAFT_338823 [Filobasidium floriforme]KAG7575394.1 hypothetical protein FFLO_00384 [Filobasidium floriforme]KAH8089514.1 hypothetical protein HD553DRAFT_338823 [Filobasidium floriforme]
MITTFELASADIWRDATDGTVVEALQRLVILSAKGVPNLKNVERIMAAMKASISLLKVRAATAETLYLTLQELEIDEDEELDELLTSVDWTSEEAKASVSPLVERLKQVFC